jgi:hypothetical protein
MHPTTLIASESSLSMFRAVCSISGGGASEHGGNRPRELLPGGADVTAGAGGDGKPPGASGHRD